MSMKAENVGVTYSPAWDGARLNLAAIGAAVVVCELDGTVVGMTPEAGQLLTRLGIDARSTPFALPESLWKKLATIPTGEAADWAPAPELRACLGCTRYPLGDRHTFLLMREVSDKRRQLLRSLHRQRLESTGKLVASVAHDLRAPLSGIVYHAELLAQCQGELTREEVAISMRDIRASCRLLQRTIDGLLDYARIGPRVDISLGVDEVFAQLASFVRPLLREGGHKLSAAVRPGAEWIRGNPIVVQQALINLVVNAFEAKKAPCNIEITAEPSADGRSDVTISVVDDGPGVPESMSERIFEAFFTTKPRGTGLGLTVSREAMRDLGGDLRVLPNPDGACFLLLLPTGDASDVNSRTAPNGNAA